MNIRQFVGELNALKPTPEEIKKSLLDFGGEEYVNRLLRSEIESYDFNITNEISSKDVLDNILRCTNIAIKNMGAISFTTKPFVLNELLFFATTENEYDIYRDINSDHIYVKHISNSKEELKQIAKSVDEFLRCLLLYFRMHVEFVFRKEKLNLSEYSKNFNNILGKDISWFFNEFVDEVSSGK